MAPGEPARPRRHGRCDCCGSTPLGSGWRLRWRAAKCRRARRCSDIARRTRGRRGRQRRLLLAHRRSQRPAEDRRPAAERHRACPRRGRHCSTGRGRLDGAFRPGQRSRAAAVPQPARHGRRCRSMASTPSAGPGVWRCTRRPRARPPTRPAAWSGRSTARRFARVRHDRRQRAPSRPPATCSRTAGTTAPPALRRTRPRAPSVQVRESLAVRSGRHVREWMRAAHARRRRRLADPGGQAAAGVGGRAAVEGIRRRRRIRAP